MKPIIIIQDVGVHPSRRTRPPSVGRGPGAKSKSRPDPSAVGPSAVGNRKVLRNRFGSRTNSTTQRVRGSGGDDAGSQTRAAIGRVPSREVGRQTQTRKRISRENSRRDAGGRKRRRKIRRRLKHTNRFDGMTLDDLI